MSISGGSVHTSPEKPRSSSKRIQLWSARRLSGLKRSKSTPTVRGQMEGDSSPKERRSWEDEQPESVQPSSGPAWKEDDLVEGNEQEQGEAEEEQNGSKARQNGAVAGGNGVMWTDDAESTHTAFKEDATSVQTFEDDGNWAPNLFYAYARRTDDPRFSRFLLTFSSARVCAEWWSLLQYHFGGSPSNTREGAQFFSFTGDDIPGRAWKHTAFSHLRPKWMYSQLGDAVGAMGKGQEIIPLQNEKGYPVSSGANMERPTLGGRSDTPDRDLERAPSRGSFFDSLGQSEKDTMAKQLRRSSKRDSAILLPSSPLINNIVGSSHERSHSLPVLPPDSHTSPSTSNCTSTVAAAPTSTGEKAATSSVMSFDFERMTQNLTRIERLMDSQATQLRSLEHVQAANLERLTAALISNADMIRELGAGQARLGGACEELRRAVKTKTKTDSKNKEKDKEKEKEKENRETQGEQNDKPSVGSASVVDPAGVLCEHKVKKGPRKIGRQVVGYVYADGPHGEGPKTIVPAAEAVVGKQS